MALPHATSGQLIDIRPLGTRISSSVSNALFKTPQLELMRLVLPCGKGMPEHQSTQTLRAGELVYLAGGEKHSLHALEDSSVLLTLLLQH
jgi:hypothetical protein